MRVDTKVRAAGDRRRSAGVPPAVAGESRSRTSQVLTAQEERQIEAEGEAQQGAGRMPAPQRARRPRYILRSVLTSMSRTPATAPPCWLTELLVNLKLMRPIQGWAKAFGARS
jgi:hypothetical protein